MSIVFALAPVTATSVAPLRLVEQAYGAVVNPMKPDAVTFTTADKVIVVSES